jgi:hypothetical protein
MNQLDTIHYEDEDNIAPTIPLTQEKAEKLKLEA